MELALRLLDVRVQSVVDQVLDLVNTPLIWHDVSDMDPNAAVESMRAAMPTSAVERARWKRSAKISAILGSCPRARGSFASGLRNWLKFAEVSLGGSRFGLPPTLDSLLEWSHGFRCVGTFSITLAICVQRAWHSTWECQAQTIQPFAEPSRRLLSGSCFSQGACVFDASSSRYPWRL